MRMLIPLFLLFAAACGDDTTTPHQFPDLSVGVTCGATMCQPGALCCPGQCGDPTPFCSDATSCPEASCDMGRTTD